MRESQGEREPHLDEKEEGQNGSMERTRVDSTVKEGRFQEGEERQAKRTSLGEVGKKMSG